MNLRVKGSSDGHPSAARSSRHSRQVFVALAHWHCPTHYRRVRSSTLRQLLHPALWSGISWDTMIPWYVVPCGRKLYRSTVRQRAQPQCRGIAPLKTRGLSISGAASSPKTPTATGSHTGLEVLPQALTKGNWHGYLRGSARLQMRARNLSERSTARGTCGSLRILAHSITPIPGRKAEDWERGLVPPRTWKRRKELFPSPL
ncbi:hypothetical protein EV401DRAFT_2198511 [Pisolithus croceorrhizus]|nr:hypothetical protein EV401DRAFT_2198511 [Pisolithus croceorrhizus]